MAGTGRKILLSIFEPLPAASGRACWVEQEVALLAGRYDVDVLCLKTEDLSHIERLHGARVLRVPVVGDSVLVAIQTYQRALARQLESEDYLLCHSHSLWDALALLTHKKRAGFRVVHEVLGPEALEFQTLHPQAAAQLEKTKSLAQLERTCLLQSDALLVGSEAVREWVCRQGAAPEKVELLYPRVDFAAFAGAETSRHPGTILYLGSLAPWQGVATLLRAMEQLAVTTPLRLSIRCPRADPFRHEALGKIQMMGLTRRVEILDEVPVEQLARVVKRCDLAVVPLGNHERNRRGAALPHKLLVYLACERPVVAARQPVLEELLTDGVHALMFPPGDASALAAAIKRVAFDRELANGLANRARLLVGEKLRLGAAATKLRSLYRQLLAYREDTDRVMVASNDSDTVPGITPPGEAEEEQFRAPGLEVTEDTVELPLQAVGAEPEPSQVETREEIVFQRVEDEDTAPRPAPDAWQVMPLEAVKMEPEPPPTPSGRYLLGGPPYPVERPSAQHAPDEPIMLGDDDVQRLDEDTPDTHTDTPATGDVPLAARNPGRGDDTDRGGSPGGTSSA